MLAKVSLPSYFWRRNLLYFSNFQKQTEQKHHYFYETCLCISSTISNLFTFVFTFLKSWLHYRRWRFKFWWTFLSGCTIIASWITGRFRPRVAYIANFPCLANHLDRRQIWPGGFSQEQKVRESGWGCVFWVWNAALVFLLSGGQGKSVKTVWTKLPSFSLGLSLPS